MIVNGKEFTGHAQTYASTDFTNKFWNMDRIMFAMSPFLTFEESDKIMIEMEKRAKSQYEGNWTHSDCLYFLRETLGNDRWNAIERMWELNSQNAIRQLYRPEELKETWVDPITMCEVSEEQRLANPGQYILIQIPK